MGTVKPRSLWVQLTPGHYGYNKTSFIMGTIKPWSLGTVQPRSLWIQLNLGH